MLDKLKISIPFKEEFTYTTQQNKSGEYVSYLDIKECARRGIRLEARAISITGEQGKDEYEVSELNHPFESLPSHYTGIAFKIYQGTKNRYPCLEMKCSPAKIIQGHNVYGSTSIGLGASEMLVALITSYPDLFEMLDIVETKLDLLDATYSARLASQMQAVQVINQLKNVSNKHIRTPLKQEYDTTVYFSKNSSRHVDRKVYLKHSEFMHQLNRIRASNKKQPNESNARLIEVMSNPQLQNHALNLIRFEASAKRRYLDEMSIPRNLFDVIRYQVEYEKDGKNLIEDIWNKAFRQLFEAFEGENMTIFNDEEIHIKLKQTFYSITPKGNTSYAKADRLFRFYRSLMSDGYRAVYDSFSSRATFKRHLDDLMAIGFSKAQLQNLHGSEKSNVIPLVQVIKVDFTKQRPADYIEPEAGHLSKCYNLTPKHLLDIYPRSKLRVA